MMERTSNCCCTRASLVTLFAVVIFPVRSECSEYNYKSLTEMLVYAPYEKPMPLRIIKAKPECCAKEDAELRTRDIDYDSCVGLMGRRSVAQPKRHIDHTFADMLGRLTGFHSFRNGMPRLLHLRPAVAHSSLAQRATYQTY